MSQANCGSVRRTAKYSRRVAASLPINLRYQTRKKNQISRSSCMLRFIRQVCNMKPPVNVSIFYILRLITFAILELVFWILNCLIPVLMNSKFLMNVLLLQLINDIIRVMPIPYRFKTSRWFTYK